LALQGVIGEAPQEQEKSPEASPKTIFLEKAVVMTLKEIVEKCSGLSVYEKRKITDEYVEIIICSKDIDEWLRILTNILGPAIKPAGLKPTKEDSRLTNEYGGIEDNQILFKKEFQDAAAMAMFWPWGSGIYVTLKLVLLKKSSPRKKIGISSRLLWYNETRIILQRSVKYT
jgi:hypothetical protein